MRLIDADNLREGIACHKKYTDQEYETDRQWALGYNAGIERALFSITYAHTIDAEPVVRCKDCAFFRDRHVLTNDGQRKSYDEMPPEAFSILGDGGVTGAYGINVGSQCLVDCNKGYSDDKTVFRSPDEFCARAMKKEE